MWTDYYGIYITISIFCNSQISVFFGDSLPWVEKDVGFEMIYMGKAKVKFASHEELSLQDRSQLRGVFAKM